MRHVQSIHSGPAAPAFEIDAQEALTALQAALAAALEALPEYPRRAPDLARALGLERNAAWKLFRLAHERDVLAAARFVPGASSIGAFLSAGAAAGIAQARLAAVQEAAERFSQVVRLHAGDRASADIMLGARTGEAGELVLRRNAFRSLSYLAGVQARAQLQTFILAPSERSPELLDGISIHGFLGLTRMRPDAPVVIGKAMSTDNDGAPTRSAAEEPIDGPLAPGEHVPLLKEFCSQPLPSFRHGPGERGFVENELRPGPVGRTGATTFMAGTLIRGVGARHASADQTTLDVVARVRTPTALLICDLLISNGVADDRDARAGVYSDLFGLALMRGDTRERYRLEPRPVVQHLGSCSGDRLGIVQTPHVPRYTRMLERVLDQVGWKGLVFSAYRVMIEYPFSPTSVMLTLDLKADGPQAGP